jgi:hypothetical protein
MFPLESRVLAIDPIPRGLGFAILEGPTCLVDWGMTDVRMKSRRRASLGRLVVLIDRYQPEVLVLEDWRRAECRRSPRVRKLLYRSAVVAVRHGLKVFPVSRRALHDAFADLDQFTKDTCARAVVTRFPELEAWLPPRRKPWMSESHRAAIFDAVAFGLAYLARRRRQAVARNARVPSATGASAPPI